MGGVQRGVPWAPAGARSVLRPQPPVSLLAMNDHLRTGADKGNPTV